jgi:SNF2 family DNA or RNA helicase
MIISFSKDKSNVLFLHEDHKEYVKLSKFPGFIKLISYYSCPAVLPIAFNLVQRLKSKFKNIKYHGDILEWLNSEFKLKELPTDFNFITKPLDFQVIALRFLYTLGSAGILLDPGMGKSKVVLDYIALQKFSRSIVVCPAALLFVWEDEIVSHRNDLTYYIVKSTDWELELPNILSHQVVIINYNKLVILKHRLKEIKFDYIHIDEFLIKDPKTSRTKSVTELSRQIPYRSGGSGTLINNSPLDAFSPTRFLQPSLVGWNYSNFFEQYAVLKDARSSGTTADSTINRKIVVGFRDKNEVRSILESCCIVMTKEIWLKLPDKIFIDRYVQMGDNQKEAYYSLLRNKIINLAGNEIKVDNPLSTLTKLYQISQGFVYVNETEEDTEDCLDDILCNNESTKKKPKKSNRKTLFFKHQPKIEELRKLLTNELKNRKCIIWFNLDGEYELIEKLLIELGETYLSIRGKDKKIGEKVRKFNNDETISRLVCQSKSVNYGITVLGKKCSEVKDSEDEQVFPSIDPRVYTEVFYSINFSSEVYTQQLDRIHRLGQTHECMYYRIFANNPVETKLRQAISDKLDLRREMLRDFSVDILNNNKEEYEPLYKTDLPEL